MEYHKQLDNMLLNVVSLGNQVIKKGVVWKSAK